MSMKVGLLGGGSWGTTVASLIAKNAAVTLWARDQAAVDEINTSHSNEKYLPGATLPANLVATSEMQSALSQADVVVMGIPSHGFRSALLEAGKYIRPGVPIISLTKGLELVTADEDLQTPALQEIRVRAGESLMRSGYIPEATINKINQWLEDFRSKRALETQHAPD